MERRETIKPLKKWQKRRIAYYVYAHRGKESLIFGSAGEWPEPFTREEKKLVETICGKKLRSLWA
jgi:hypothetical protein